ncbi:MAG: TolC family outer membrane protein [Betaproteobacteria bacterium]|nr:TolC family outer membrane protein [Betaproteobacteria bacterium]
MGLFVLRSAAFALLALGLGMPVFGRSLSDAVRQAIETNPSVLSAAHNRQAADAAIGVARGGYFPRLDVVVGDGRERSTNAATIGLARAGAPLDRHEELVVLSQTLWDGLGTKSEVERRRALAESSAHRLQGTAEDVAMQAINAYLEVVRNRELLAYANDNLNAHERSYDQVRLHGGGDTGWRADLEQMETRLALAKSNAAQAQNTLLDAETAYRAAVGEAPVDLSDPGGNGKALPDTVEQAIQIAYDQHPFLKSARADIEAAHAQRRAARSAFYPRIDLELSASNHRNLDGIPFPDRERSAMLRLRWNLFRGGADNARLAETEQQVGEISEIANRTRRQVESSVRLGYSAYQAARERLPLLEQYVLWSDKTRQAYAKQFVLGQQSLLNLLNSENEYFSARSAYLNARFNGISAHYRVLFAMGGLLAAMGIAVAEGTNAGTK